METFSAFLLLACAVYCSVRSGFIQFRRFGASLRCAIPRPSTGARVSPFEAAATSLAATIGTGNIAGVAGAILLGGPGTIFWMWISAIFGMASKYVEIYFGMRMRHAGAPGPLAYLRRLTPRGGLARVYALLCAGCCLCMGNLVQVNTVSEAVLKLAQPAAASTEGNLLPALCVGTATLLLVALAQRGGAKSIGRIAALLVPFMSVLYIAGTLAVVVMNAAMLPAAFRAILRDAWSEKAFLIGMARGVFTHEAGLGTAAFAHANADCADAHQEGLYGIFEVFFDTIVMCTLTALAVLVSGAVGGVSDGVQNSALVVDAFSTIFGDVWAAVIIAVSLALFAFSSILSFAMYGSDCAGYLFGRRGGQCYRIVFLLLLPIGAAMRISLAWRLAEWANMALGVLNAAALVLLLRKPRLAGARRRAATACAPSRAASGE